MESSIVTRMPRTWSDWVGVIGALVGTIGLVLAYAGIRRDRSDVSVKLTREFGFTATLETQHPGIRFGPHRGGDSPEDFFVLTAVNAGLRPVHIEKVFCIWVNPNGAGSMSELFPHDVLLSEERRRTAIAVATDSGYKKAQLWQVGFVDDTGREYAVYGPTFQSRISRWRWEQQRDKLVALQQAPKPPASALPRKDPRPVPSTHK